MNPFADILAVHPASLDADALLAECEVRHTRRSGPGGQHRNKVQTAVVLTHRPTGVQAEAAERRSQSENLSVAARRLRLRLAVTHRTERSDEESPSALWRSRCRSGRIVVNPEHADFPAMLAEAMDLLFACGGETSQAGERLGCTPTQLVRFLKHEPEAFEQFNALRERHQLPRLRHR